MVKATGSGPDGATAPALTRIAQLAAKPDAVRWARDCAWVPGSGHCRNRPCSTECVFREQRTAEAEWVTSARRQRRPSQRPGAERPAPASAALLVLRKFLRSVRA
jgi:hypothetical protein